MEQRTTTRNQTDEDDRKVSTEVLQRRMTCHPSEEDEDQAQQMCVSEGKKTKEPHYRVKTCGMGKRYHGGIAGKPAEALGKTRRCENQTTSRHGGYQQRQPQARSLSLSASLCVCLSLCLSICPSLPTSWGLWIRCKLSATAPALCLPAAMLPTLMVMDSPSEPIRKPLIKHFLL